MSWIELVAGFACNCACPGCHSNDADPTKQMPSEQAVAVLRDGRARGARHVWFGGGEPTLRRDFLPLLKVMAQLGYERRRVQTNGLVFANPAAVERSVAAGMTEVSVLHKSADPDLHDALMGRPGTHALLDAAMGHLCAPAFRGRLSVEVDVLLTSKNVGELARIVTSSAARGVRRVTAWVFAASAGAGAAELSALIPEPVALRESIRAGVAAARTAGIGFVSLHTPHCFVEPADFTTTFDPAAMGLFVVEPSGRGFVLSESEMERGAWVPACDACAVKGACRGPRREYVARFGAGFVRAFTPAEVAGRDARGSVLG